MNAEQQIAAACASIRQGNGPSSHGVANRGTTASYKPPSRNEDGHPKRFSAPAGGDSRVDNPWPPKPGIARASRRYFAAAVKIASGQRAGLVAMCLLLAGALRVIIEMGSTKGPVIVHLLYSM